MNDKKTNTTPETTDHQDNAPETTTDETAPTDLTTEEIDNLIAKYSINTKNADYSELTFWKYNLTDDTLAIIKSNKSAIANRLREQHEARYLERQKRWQEFEAKKAAVPGLNEIEDAINRRLGWQYDFEKSFEDEDGYGGKGCGPAPKYDFEKAIEKYPAAAMYLECKYQLSLPVFEGRELIENIQNLILDGKPYEDAVHEWENARQYPTNLPLVNWKLQPTVAHLLDC